MPAQLRRLLADLAEQALKGRVLRVERLLIHERRHDRLKEPEGALTVLERRRPMLALQQQLQATGEALDLRDPTDDPDVVEHVGRRLVHVLSLRHGEDPLDLALAAQRPLDGTERLVPAGDDRRRHAREDHRLTQRQDRKVLPVGPHLWFRRPCFGFIGQDPCLL